MKGILLPACLVVAAAIGQFAAAQQPANSAGAGDQPTLSPEMWYYQQQLERLDDPKHAVRRNAEFQAQQRLARLEAMKWYGFSNARPAVSPTPFTSSYGARWQSGFHRPHVWQAAGRPTIIVTGRGYWQ